MEENNFGFSIDSTVRVNYEPKVLTVPKQPLNDKEIEFLYHNSFKHFYYQFKSKHFKSKCLEISEYSEYYSNKNFMEGRAYIFFRRTASVFDKSIYGLPPTGEISDSQALEDISRYEISCAIRFKCFKKVKNVYLFEDAIVGKTIKDIQSFLNCPKNSKLRQNAKRAVAFARLAVYWKCFYDMKSGKLIPEIIRDKQKRVKPLLREKGVSKEKLREYHESMKTAGENAVDDDIDFNFANETNSDEKIVSLFKHGEMSEYSFEARKYVYCLYHLEMSTSEIILEFGDRIEGILQELGLNKRGLEE